MLVTLEPGTPVPGSPWVVVHRTAGPQPLVVWDSAHDDWWAVLEVLAGQRVVLVTEEAWAVPATTDSSADGSIVVRNRWLWNDDHSHAYGRGSDVIDSPWVSQYEHMNSMRDHVYRALSSFGDGATVTISFAVAAGSPATTGDER